MNKTNRTFAGLAIAAAAVSAYIGGDALVGHIRFAQAEQKVNQDREDLRDVQGLSNVFRTVGRAVTPSVVQIQVHKQAHSVSLPILPNMPDDGDGSDQSGVMPEEVGTGSGVIIEVDEKTSTAYILTNNHVAGDATKMTVTLADGRTIDNGKTIGNDPKSDLAVVKITADHVIPAIWGDSGKLERGDWVLAFGSPFGYVGSMTHGIVSALDRHQVGILSNVDGYEDFIQVDAPINPGNSGGPLVNVNGQVVGINTAIASRSGGFQGIGFAIPSNQAKAIYAMLKEHGKVTRGWLGVKIIDVAKDTATAKVLGYTGDTGVIVDEIFKGTPSFGKLQPSDVVEKVNGTPVADSLELRNLVAMTPPGKDVKLTVFRDKKETEVTVTLGEQPDNLVAMQMRPGNTTGRSEARDAASTLGLTLTDLTDDLARKYNLGDARDGALVTGVRRGSLGNLADIQVGDLITRVGDEQVKNADEAVAALAKQNVHKGVRLNITNSDGLRAVTVGDQQQ